MANFILAVLFTKTKSLYNTRNFSSDRKYYPLHHLYKFLREDYNTVYNLFIVFEKFGDQGSWLGAGPEQLGDLATVDNKFSGPLFQQTCYCLRLLSGAGTIRLR